MGKMLTILGGCLAVAGGLTYGLYTYNSPGCSDLSGCPVARMKCCGEPTGCMLQSESADPAGGMAVAGPVALFVTSPVNAACPSQVIAKTGCCADALVPVAASCENPGLQAAAGVTATVK